jgi:predicted nuclease of predicted toxin-antitoxin system
VRFVLDEDVSAAVAKVLKAGGHDAWTVSEAGLSGIADDDVTIYASEKVAGVLSHDVEFGAKRRKNPIGWHIQLGCKEVDAAVLIEEHLDAMVAALGAFPDLYVYLSKSGINTHHVWS